MGRYDGFLICSDLDGTLLPGDKRLPQANLDALETFMAEGGRFTVCTGRGRRSYRPMLDVIACNAPIILGNGSLIYDYAEEGPLHTVCLPEGADALCRDVLARFPLSALEVSGDDTIYLHRPNRFSDNHIRFIGFQAQEVPEIDEIPKPWLKALFVGPEDELAEIETYVKQRHSDAYDIFFSHSVLLEVVSRGAGKGDGVAWMADYLGISHDKVFVMGDFDNDLSMLTRFHSFAPANAAPHIRASADHVVCDCREGILRDVLAYLEAVT